MAATAATACSGSGHRATPIGVRQPLGDSTTTTPSTTEPPTSTSTSGAKKAAATTTTAKRVTTTTVRRARVLGPGLAGKVIAIDPGHNGGNASHPSEINRQVDAGGFQKACDTTGTATNAGYPEAAYTFDVAARLAGVLRAAGATVVLTRDTNTGVGPCIDERAGIGNRVQADAAVSVHADGGPSGGRGFHVIEPALVKGYTEPIVEPSARLGTALRDAFAADTPMPTSTYIGSHGIDVRGDLGGLNLSKVPKVFIETGNMRNATDAGLLSDAGFRQQAAEGIAAGLASYFSG
jgi:N-acetylmuramoyl-L-alanine amidase